MSDQEKKEIEDDELDKVSGGAHGGRLGPVPSAGTAPIEPDTPGHGTPSS
jgi:bacteriocin-like protein